MDRERKGVDVIIKLNTQLSNYINTVNLEVETKWSSQSWTPYMLGQDFRIYGDNTFPLTV